MSVKQKAIRRLALLDSLRRHTNFSAIRGAIDADASLVVWLHHRYPEGWLRWAGAGGIGVKDAALLTALAEAGHRFRVVTGAEVGKVVNSPIAYSIDNFNPIQLNNYMSMLYTTAAELESQGNTLYPSADEVRWWENKMYMHEQFEARGIRTPPTTLWYRDSSIDLDAFTYPVLVKEPHSYHSRGIHKVDSAADLAALRAKFAAKGDHELIVQELLNMRRDLRVVVIGDAIPHHYWRINPDKEWRTTTTRHGAFVDFVTFPEQWRSYIIDAFGRSGLRNGAFDVAWQDDDLDTEPYFLELSPGYTPNAVPSAEQAEKPYSDWKNQLRGPGNYPDAFVSGIFENHRRVVEVWDIPR